MYLLHDLKFIKKLCTASCAGVFIFLFSVTGFSKTYPAPKSTCFRLEGVKMKCLPTAGPQCSYVCPGEAGTVDPSCAGKDPASYDKSVVFCTACASIPGSSQPCFGSACIPKTSCAPDPTVCAGNIVSYNCDGSACVVGSMASAPITCSSPQAHLLTDTFSSCINVNVPQPCSTATISCPGTKSNVCYQAPAYPLQACGTTASTPAQCTGSCKTVQVNGDILPCVATCGGTATTCGPQGNTFNCDCSACTLSGGSAGGFTCSNQQNIDNHLQCYNVTNTGTGTFNCTTGSCQGTNTIPSGSGIFGQCQN